MTFSKDQIQELHREIDTPALIVEQVQLEENIMKMQEMASLASVQLRPHIKTHKSALIAKKQLSAGAIGITVAKVGEAEVMAAAGITDIFIANQITHPLKIKRLANLHNKVLITVGLDHPEQIKLLNGFFADSDHPLKVLIEIDSGLKRCGVTVGKELVDLAQRVNAAPGLSLSGIFTHAGQVYAASTKEKIQQIGQFEAEIMADSYNLLKKERMKIEIVSVGSTPTVVYSAQHSLVNEIRPGNYVFYDNIQYVLGSCMKNQWALAVLATVVSQPAPDRIVIDAGSKALNLDRGAHATQQVAGFGRIINLSGEIVRLSEEHGVVMLEFPGNIPMGSPVLIIPNHACAVTNLYSHYYLINAAGTINEIPIDARGRSQ
jgi:D-serine deaminase-like pyridoxal phosphate-dependent protein